MPRFFIDTSDGDLEIRDDQGIEFLCAEDARVAALAALPDMARDKIPDGDRRLFFVSVRDEHGNTIYKASLFLAGAWGRGAAGIRF